MDRHHLGFLIALGSLPIACTGDDDDDGGSDASGTAATDDTTASDSNGSVSITTSASSTGNGPTTASSDDTSGGTVGDDTVGDDTTTGEDDTTTTGGDDTTTGGDDTTTGGGAVCQEFTNWYVQCYPEYAAYAPLIEAYCNDYLSYAEMTDGPACAAAMEDMFACLSQLDCGDDIEACGAELTAFEAACPTLADGGEGGEDDGGDEPPP